MAGRLAAYVRQERLMYGFAGIAAVLIIWEALNRSGAVRSVLISSPTQVVHAAIRELNGGMLWVHIWATSTTWLLGLAIAAVVGIGLGLVGGWYTRVRLVVLPWLIVLEAVPSLALIPLFILWFGIDLEFKVFIVFMSAVFFVAVNVLAGVANTSRAYVDVATSFNASQLRILSTVVLPGSIPYVVTGLRQGAARGLVGAVVADYFASSRGLGFMINTGAATMNTSRVMLGVVLLGAIGLLTGEILSRVERHFEKWRRAID